MQNRQPNTIYNFNAIGLDGKDTALSGFKGKVLLIVNTATHCGQVAQLHKLEKIYNQYKNRGFEILAFPCNQFAGQEPLTGKAIEDFCKTRYNISFPIFQKICVRGYQAHPLFQFFGDKKQNGKFSIYPLWNYYKFLVDSNGYVISYFTTLTQPDSKKIMGAIEHALSGNAGSPKGSTRINR